MLEIELVGTLPVAHNRIARTLREAGEYMVEQIKQTFDEGGRPEPWPPLKFAQPPALFSSGKLRNSGEYAVGDSEVVISWGRGLGIYPLVQQYGAEIKVTEKMKKFFWAKYLESNQEKWMHMALKKVGSTITIDPRVYVQFLDENIEYLSTLFENKVIEFEGPSESNVDFNRGISAGVL